MTGEQEKARFRVKPYRRVVQLAVLALLVLIPYSSQNPVEWAPSRIVQGQIPVPTTLDIAGDTWSFSFKGFELSHPLALFDTVFSAHVIYLPLLIAAVIPLVMTIVMGRVFCSWLCPVGFILELNMRIRDVFKRLGMNFPFTLKDTRYGILAACLFLSFFLAIPVVSMIDPPHTLGRELMNVFTHKTVSFAGMSLLLGLLFLDTFVTTRACCAKLCPSGAGLALLGKARALRIHLNKDTCIECGNCDTSCPYKLAPMGLLYNHPSDWTSCDNCGLCRDSCPTGAIAYTCSVRDNNRKEGETCQ